MFHSSPSSGNKHFLCISGLNDVYDYTGNNAVIRPWNEELKAKYSYLISLLA